MNKAIENGISILEYAMNKNISVKQASINLGYGKNYVHNIHDRIDGQLQNKSITREEYKIYKSLYDDYRNNIKSVEPSIKPNKTTNNKKKNVEINNIVIKNCLEILDYAIKGNLSVNNATVQLGFTENYFFSSKRKLESKLKTKAITQEEYDSFCEVYNKYLDQQNLNKISKRINISKENLNGLSPSERLDATYDAYQDEKFDSRSVGEAVRDENGKITHYKYKILIRENPELAGELSRGEMETVYRLYTADYGANLTVRAVSREFPNLCFRDFKRILRAFNITKSSIPQAPHTLEELSTEKIAELVFQDKERNLLKYLELHKGKHVEQAYLNAQKEIIELKDTQKWVDGIVQKYIQRTEVKSKSKNTTNKLNKNNKGVKIGPATLSIFGDTHYGKKYDNPIYGRGYNKEIAHERAMQIAKETIKEHKRTNSREIAIVFMGDILESARPEGMREGHLEEMDIVREDQIFYAVDSMKEMLQYIVDKSSPDTKIKFHGITGNHDRMAQDRDEDKGRIGGRIVLRILQRELESEKLSFNFPENNLLRFVVGKTLIFAQHGDTSLHKKKPSELVNLYGEAGCYSLLLTAHWHSYKVEEGTNYLALKIPPVTSTDKFIMEELGSNTLPGFIIGSEPENGYGLDYKKVTLY